MLVCLVDQYHHAAEKPLIARTDLRYAGVPRGSGRLAQALGIYGLRFARSSHISNSGRCTGTPYGLLRCCASNRRRVSDFRSMVWLDSCSFWAVVLRLGVRRIRSWLSGPLQLGRC